jgi:four helix bundle protein
LAAAKKFEDLLVFQRAYKVSLEVHRISIKLPLVEQRDLGSQMRRASKSICANLAEGFGKQSQSISDFHRFVKISIGSADEMRVWVRYCYDLGYIDQALWQALRDEYEHIAKMLQGLVKRTKAKVSDP